MRWMSLPVLLGLTLLLRLLWVAVIPVSLVSDSGAYDTFAQNIALHGVYGWTPDRPGAYWAVGASAIYAGAYLVFGVGPLGVVIVNLIASLLIAWSLWDLGRRWFGEDAGRWAVVVFAIWPLTIQYVTVLASELHFMALTGLALMAWDRWREGAGAARWGFLLVAGLMLAGATYLRPIALLIPAALAIATTLHCPRRALASWGAAAVATAVIFAAVAPWSARNEEVFGEPVFMSTNFGANFWMGNHPGTTGEYAPLPDEIAGMSEIERNAYLKDAAFGYVKEAPGAFVGRTILKAFRLHQRETIGVVWNEAALEELGGGPLVMVLKAGSTGYWYLMLVAGLAGVVLLVRRGGMIAGLVATPVWLWLYFTAVHAVIVVGDRYHMPAIPMIALLAGVALATLTARRAEAPQD